jgi:hypothetical protein
MIKMSLLFTSMFLLTGCSMIGGQSINHLFLGILGTLFFVSCQSDFYTVKPAKVAEPDPESEPAPEPELCTVGASLESALPLYVDAGELYVPNAELQQINNSSSNLENHAATYNTCGGTNYFKLDKLATSTLIRATVGKTANDFVVITPQYFNLAGGAPQIELLDGDDTLVFEGYQDYENSISTVNMGAGDDKVILGSAVFNDYLSPGQLVMGAGADKLYLAPIDNPSIIELDLSEDKIVLTGGLIFAQLTFRDGGSYYSIRMRESKTASGEQNEVNLVNIKKTAALNNINLLDNSANFEISEIVSAKKGLYKAAGTKFPVAPVSVTAPTYLLEVTATGDIDGNSDLWFTDYNGSGVSYEYVSDGWNITYDYIAGVNGAGDALIDTTTKPTYFSTPNFSWTSGRRLQNGRDVYLSDWNGKKGYTQLSPNMPFADTSFGLYHSGGNTVVSHQYDESNMEIANDLILVLNGKAGGVISHHYGAGNIVLSRMASGAILETTPGQFHFYLADGLSFSDLTFVLEDSMVSIKVLDDSNKLITLLRLRNVVVNDVNSIANFTTGGSL